MLRTTATAVTGILIAGGIAAAGPAPAGLPGLRTLTTTVALLPFVGTVTAGSAAAVSFASIHFIAATSPAVSVGTAVLRVMVPVETVASAASAVCTSEMRMTAFLCAAPAIVPVVLC